MDPTIVGLLGLIVFLAMLFLGMPVSFAMLLSGFWGLWYLRSADAAFNLVCKDIFIQFSAYSLTVVPMFVFMGFVAYYSGIGAGLFKLSYKVIGHFRGGLALAAQLACAIFGAICGSLAASVATIGTIAYPEMKKFNYADSLSSASIAAGASIGSLIPPSVLFIIYGISAEQSIGRLFLAGIFPGILLTLTNMVVIYILCRRNPQLGPAGERSTLKDIVAALNEGLIEVIIVFVVSLGGLFIGWFSPTEAGAVGALALLIVTAVQKKMDWPKLKASLLDTTKLSAMIFLLIAGATVFGHFFALSRIPANLATWVTMFNLPNFVVIMLIILIYFLLGMFIDSLALILLTVPIFYPLIVGTMGYDPIWFGAIIILVAVMGAITPPVGLNLFIMKSVAPSLAVSSIFKGVWPFVLALLFCIILIIIFPEIAIWLPQVVYGS
ncbi:MAG: TRAP transporter large permease [Peptococcaceae bacterium]|jgi:tripartite ATP-independent transporter DctM subunit|nr:TRAP transporter large permease [Peptococcaceae bacterium]